MNNNLKGNPAYKRGIPHSWDETFYMFLTLPGSRQNDTEFYLGQPGSCNDNLSL